MRAPVRRVDKPWGYELIWAHTDQYVGKILHVNRGEALSLQMHHVKDETMYVLAGRIRMEVGDAPDRLEHVELGRGEAIHLLPKTVHRVTALEDTDLLEASTPHLDDLVRFEDRYGRTAGQP
jgi:mannose-6-phosphate isomerase-like protein (cupin superfamily)